MDFLEQLKKELRPSPYALEKADEIVKKIDQEIKKNKIKAFCLLGGSVAKGTFLKDDFDIDLFVKFDYSLKEKNISEILAKILEKFNPSTIHGSRDYFSFKIEKYNFEVVPVLNIDKPEKAENVIDLSPFHVEWLKKRLKKGQEDEIRLMKKFCKSIHVYGAESYIRGFSGHVIDILIIYYGTFLNLIKESRKWKPRVIIDVEKHYKNNRELLFNMNQSKIAGPMIVVDPILKTRNAASSLSYEKFSIFRKSAVQFLKKPSIKFFVEEKIGKTLLKKKYKKNLIILILKAEKGNKDVVGSKILKAFKFMKSELIKKGFNIKKSGWHWNKKQRILFWFVFKSLILPEKKIIEGPPLEKKEHVKKFKEKYKKVFIKNDKLFAEIKNYKRSALEIIDEISKEDYFKSKVKLKKIES